MNATLVATSPAELATAQHGLISWCQAKLKECVSELATAHGLVQAMRDAKLSDARGRRTVTAAKKRITFYEKVKAALEAGYYILPPFPVSAFAIRVQEGSRPPARESTDRWPFPVRGDVLPVGEGEYVNPNVSRYNYTNTKDDKNEVVRWFKNYSSWSGLAFPVQVVRPELIEATGRAIQSKIFDSLGVFTQAKGDPIIVGQIYHWKQYRQPLTFFVAWWVDTREL